MTMKKLNLLRSSQAQDGVYEPSHLVFTSRPSLQQRQPIAGMTAACLTVTTVTTVTTFSRMPNQKPSQPQASVNPGYVSDYEYV